LKPRITIFGVGGAGGNAINNMIRSQLEGVEFVAANTDSQALQHSLAKNKIQLGIKTTKGLGAGSFPDRGKAAAEENVEEIEKYVEGNNMIFIAAGMGGGTGTGAAPVIGQIAREREILTVGVVTKPFHFEGKYRMETAEQGIEELKKHVDTLIVIPNQNLFRIANEHTTFESAFKMADDVLQAGVRGVTDLITMPGLVNLDFADIRTIMTKMGKAMMGTGEASGENRAIIAVEAAVSNPLLDDISIKGAKGVLVNMTGGPDMTLFEADMAVNAIKKEVDSNANIIFGSAFNENMKGKIRISVVATGIDADDFRREAKQDQEPSRFKINLSSNLGTNKNAENSEIIPVAENFFDPGISTKSYIDNIDEISDSDFKPKKNFLREEDLNDNSSPIESENFEPKKKNFSSIKLTKILPKKMPRKTRMMKLLWKKKRKLLK
jgi:cell division protein FtsZ